MFEIGEYVVFGTDGVCKVENVGPLEMEGVSKEKIYYTLMPLGKTGNARIFTPVESKRVVIRKVLSLDQAKELISGLSSIKAITVLDERKREEVYKQTVQSCDCAKLVGLIKEIQSRRRIRSAQGKKLPAVDERYYSMAENFLYSELSLPLQKAKEQIKEALSAKLEAEC